MIRVRENWMRVQSGSLTSTSIGFIRVDQEAQIFTAQISLGFTVQISLGFFQRCAFSKLRKFVPNSPNYEICWIMAVLIIDNTNLL
jgi:hypothetical protein